MYLLYLNSIYDMETINFNEKVPLSYCLTTPLCVQTWSNSNRGNFFFKNCSACFVYLGCTQIPLAASSFLSNISNLAGYFPRAGIPNFDNSCLILPVKEDADVPDGSFATNDIISVASSTRLTSVSKLSLRKFLRPNILNS